MKDTAARSVSAQKHALQLPLERIQELQEFIGEQDTDITEFDETLVRRLVKKVTVYKKKFTVEFKSGGSVDVRG